MLENVKGSVTDKSPGFSESVLSPVSASRLSDKELLKKAEMYGSNALLWRRKFIGLLPEVNKRKLYEKKDCSSIFEFAAKFGGLSQEQVRLALNLERRFEGMPALHELLVTGKESINKLTKLVSIANGENEEELSETVQKLSKGAVETFVRDVKSALQNPENSNEKAGEVKQNDEGKNANFQNQNGLFEPQFEAKGLPGQTLKLNNEVISKLYELQEKGIDINEIILKALDGREEEIATEKAQICEEIKKKRACGEIAKRYINSRTRKIIKKEHGVKCSISSCKKPADDLHHTVPFSMQKSHDPNFLAPLCREHHEIAHTVNLKVQKKRFQKLRC